jgi:hypothetical protein
MSYQLRLTRWERSKFEIMSYRLLLSRWERSKSEITSFQVRLSRWERSKSPERVDLLNRFTTHTAPHARFGLYDCQRNAGKPYCTLGSAID